jgi:hypothetical protein
MPWDAPVTSATRPVRVIKVGSFASKTENYIVASGHSSRGLR